MVNVTKCEVGQEMRAPYGAHKPCTFGPAVGTETFADINFGTSVKPFHSGADGRPGGWCGGWCGGVAGWSASIHHRVNDFGIAGTAAQHAPKCVLDRLPVRGRVTAQERGCCHHHAWGADPALRRAVAKEGGLKR